jgi:hypothetical protein
MTKLSSVIEDLRRWDKQLDADGEQNSHATLCEVIFLLEGVNEL